MATSLTFASQQTPAFSSWSDRRFASEALSQAKFDKLEASTVSSAVLFDFPWIALAESLREGMMVISRNTKPMYANQQAKEICQKFAVSNRTPAGLPSAISEVCHRLIRNGNPNTTIVAESETVEEETIRIRASWLNLPSGDTTNSSLNNRQYILVFLENRDRILQEELQFEQQKYQLTDREMEIWSLLRQDYSYQDIAKTLQISLNTVKTHVKNIYAKKRWNQVKDTREVG
ncbi:helix-turn-helix transcriptional regulator [Aerosakkonema funiforme]|uniref:Response regulator transcription factor n=1 Tax=Aerosakkonema funiforme FACHB-1375 TaxID=2949571 RepID=A0A926VLL8_9CYAN|nr:LuxR C-terminal-related transcriptional regulator [Aerosakkonema funiforme]MBD2185989.1 response regulator transcription factor [Aerosakkonema funiforme FACHB-1375]